MGLDITPHLRAGTLQKGTERRFYIWRAGSFILHVASQLKQKLLSMEVCSCKSDWNWFCVCQVFVWSAWKCSALVILVMTVLFPWPSYVAFLTLSWSWAAFENEDWLTMASQPAAGGCHHASKQHLWSHLTAEGKRREEETHVDKFANLWSF